MTEEQIIKMIEIAEEFKWDGHNKKTLECHHHNYFTVPIEKIQTWEFYPFLLYRAVEGFNEISKDDYTYIDVLSDCINYSSGSNYEWRKGEDGSNTIWYDDFKNNKHLTKQEQAIEKVLERLL